MQTPENDGAVRFLYGTALGRGLLKIVQRLHLDRLAVWYLRSRWSRPYIAKFARKNSIPLTKAELQSFPTYRDFFLRERAPRPVDPAPDHLVSPCDGWLSAFPVTDGCSFAIKGSRYRVADLLQDDALAKRYRDGLCLVFRLCAYDYHHYSYIDGGRQGQNHYIEGQLHSVQPIASEHYPIFTLNRRSWCVLDTDHFGPVVQTEIGALVVGGIVNRPQGPMARGQEKGYFDLCGSTITLLFEKGRAALLPELAERTAEGREVRVEQGQWIGTALENRQA